MIQINLLWDKPQLGGCVLCAITDSMVIVVDRKDFNSFAQSIPTICSNLSLLFTAALRGIVLLVELPVVGADVQNSNLDESGLAVSSDSSSVFICTYSPWLQFPWDNDLAVTSFNKFRTTTDLLLVVAAILVQFIILLVNDHWVYQILVLNCPPCSLSNSLLNG
jgi:hypothetical protein